MSKNITDYLHFYLGCNIQFKGQEKKGKINIENLWQLVSVHQMTYKKIVTIEAIGCVKSLDPEDIKPILRPLSDMTEEEKKDVGFDAYQMLRNEQGDRVIPSKEKGFTWAAKQTAYLLKQGFDLFDLIDAGLAIDKTTLNKQS